MDTSKLSEEEAREVLSKMFTEIGNTFNRMHVSSSSDDEDIEDDDTTREKEESAPEVAVSAPAESTDTAEPKKKRKKKKKKAAKPEIDDILEESSNIPPEELEMFDPSKSVAERVELAVTRFRKNRNLNLIRGKIFAVYLDYGGIHTGPKSFQGGGMQTGGPNDEGGEPDFEAMNAGVDRVDDDPDLVVDFTNVVATFLSQYFLDSTGWVDKVYYTDTPLVIAALLNYFLVRNVLPEHTDDLKEAFAITQRAKIELPNIKDISNGITSRFDKACSVLFGGQYYGFLDDGQWQSPEYYIKELGMDRMTAEAIVQSVTGPEVDIHALKLKDTAFMDLEIVRVELPEQPPQPEKPEEPEAGKAQKEQGQDESLAEAEANAKSVVGSTGDDAVSSDDQPQPQQAVQEPSDALAEAAKELQRIKEVPMFAKVILTHWEREYSLDQPHSSGNQHQLHWYFDAALAAKMVPGMKVVAQVHTLSNSLTYFEQTGIYPSYYVEADVDETPLDDWED
ncbi:hypothetical protein EMPS_11231 [Entomortierella parvispora]|uniref:Argonaute siRNA chaperone complex subunit Arb1 n=1 Tax=Entomortierella parvispora TaxID=205924 RepID=A0A9P3HMM8_9FUNG|nr:hypothetical protein EMPS_11231 [Entomortierella parvispora]